MRAGPLAFLRRVEQRPRSAQNISLATICAPRSEAGRKSRAFARLSRGSGEGNCKCGLLKRKKQVKRMRRFEVLLADCWGDAAYH
jgi:hypothetical protein